MAGHRPFTELRDKLEQKPGGREALERASGGEFIRCDGCGMTLFVRTADLVAHSRDGCARCGGTFSSAIAPKLPGGRS